MALITGVITMRKGFLAELDKTKLQPGEFAVCIDSETSKKKVFMCFGDGIVKELGTFEDFVAQYSQFVHDLEQLDTEIKRSQSYAVGGTGIRQGEDEDNSNYYSLISKSYANGLSGIRQGEDEDNSKYYMELSQEYSEDAEESRRQARLSEIAAKSFAMGDTGTRQGEDEDNAKYYYELALGLISVDIVKLDVQGPVTTYRIIYNNTKYIDFEVTNSTTDIQLFIDEDGDIAQL